MSDDEFLNELQIKVFEAQKVNRNGPITGWFAESIKLSITDLDRLIALDRTGASVMPRPIEQAPRDGTKILLMGNGPGFWATEGAWVGHASEWRDATSFTFKLVEPHSWLPLSALLKPQVKP